MAPGEQAVVFQCEGETLVGVLHPVAAPAARGVLIVVGGPQYRAGSHRQFVLLARALAAWGVPAFRFDYRGMGDSGGVARNFEDVGPDIRAAIDCFAENAPGLRGVVVWGLCDAASAALFYAGGDPRVTGLVLLNPWVHTEQGAARTYLRHYYLARLFDKAFWRKLAAGAFDWRKAIADLRALARKAGTTGTPADAGTSAAAPPGTPVPDLRERMEAGLRRFRGRVLLVLSGDDLTAQEFKDLVATSRGWRRLIAADRVARRDLPRANHTFSRREWRDEVARFTGEWLKSW
ncbi:MAG: hydrolase 1, exosortase A system-associated [Burkholderiales bacterium]|nr:hydrolase 1, exosortase A system-associated [Burkholderiales bacterium]